MYKILDRESSPPYLKFYDLHDRALSVNQSAMDAIVISSYDDDQKMADSRYVNLKYINKNEWIFFSNYNSKKAKQFLSNNKVSVLIYWPDISIQIRIKALISKTCTKISDQHFLSRKKEKNALAISSHQSKKAISYQAIISSYKATLKNYQHTNRPSYWGGYSFKPYYFEFWEGNPSRVNHREEYCYNKKSWQICILQP